MCKDNKEFAELVQEYRSLKALQKELSAQITSVQTEILTYMKDQNVHDIIGPDFSAKWTICTSTSYSKDKLEMLLGSDLSSVQIHKSYDRLTIS